MAFNWLRQSASRCLAIFFLSAAIAKCSTAILPIRMSQMCICTCIVVTLASLRLLHFFLSVPILPAPWIHRSRFISPSTHPDQPSTPSMCNTISPHSRLSPAPWEITHDSDWHSDEGSMLVNVATHAWLRDSRRQGAPELPLDPGMDPGMDGRAWIREWIREWQFELQDDRASAMLSPGPQWRAGGKAPPGWRGARPWEAGRDCWGGAGLLGRGLEWFSEGGWAGAGRGAGESAVVGVRCAVRVGRGGWRAGRVEGGVGGGRGGWRAGRVEGGDPVRARAWGEGAGRGVAGGEGIGRDSDWWWGGAAAAPNGSYGDAVKLRRSLCLVRQDGCSCCTRSAECPSRCSLPTAHRRSPTRTRCRRRAGAPPPAHAADGAQALPRPPDKPCLLSSTPAGCRGGARGGLCKEGRQEGRAGWGPVPQARAPSRRDCSHSLQAPLYGAWRAAVTECGGGVPNKACQAVLASLQGPLYSVLGVVAVCACARASSWGPLLPPRAKEVIG
jgi:hypothetical protein